MKMTILGYRLPPWKTVLYSTLYILIAVHLLYFLSPTSSEGVINGVRSYLMLTRAALLARRVFDSLIEDFTQLYTSMFETLFLIEFDIMSYFFKLFFDERSK